MSQLPIRQLRPRLAETTNTIENGNCTNRVLAAGLSDLQRAEATVEFMNLFRQMLNEARFFSHDERSLRGYLIEDIEKKKLKAEELLNEWCYEKVCLAEMFKFSTNVIGKLAYSTCYTLARLIKR